MFDVKPTKSGGLDFEKISRVKTGIDLREKTAFPQAAVVKEEILSSGEEVENIERQEAKKPAKTRPGIAHLKHSILAEFEKALVEPFDPIIELASTGIRVRPLTKQEPRPRLAVGAQESRGLSGKGETAKTAAAPPLFNQKVNQKGIAELKNFWAPPESFVPMPAMPKIAAAPLCSPASKEIDFWLARLGSLRRSIVGRARSKPWRFSWIALPGRNFLIYLTIISLSGLFVWWGIRGGIGARNNIIQNSGNAVANLEAAKQKLENLEFSDAANSFALAYDDLNKASGTLNELGASFLSVFGNLPGLSKVKAANNLVEAGQNISKAGESLASALATIYNNNPFSFLNNSEAGKSQKSLSKLLGDFKTVLVYTDRSIKKAGSLLADIDESVIPEDKRPLLLGFKEKIPQFQEYAGRAIDYSDFLLKFVGASGKKTYLVLLQNNSELRPTGGFPGTYAVATFEDGNLAKIFVDDIYQIDSNLRENIIPPLPMQHITPNWGMRDANWFADFPSSARKVQEFYRKNGGGGIDGVLTVTPDVIAEIFKVIGPIDMPDYGLKLDAGNFLTEIQNEVEYEADRSKPKKILTDLQPEFFKRLASQNQESWLEIFEILSNAVEQKHILAFFGDSDLQETAVKNGFAGEIKQTSADYLQIVFANIKGSKTDFVTDSSMGLETTVGEDSAVSHALTINRAHKGGGSKYGFYNRDNSAYVKIFVPKGAALESVVGQSITDFKPLIGYSGAGFKNDPDLKRVENSIYHPIAGVDEFEESGKTVFGFWLIVKPGQTKSVVLKYSVPLAGAAAGNYNLFWQKQSGTGGDLINFSFKLPNDASAVSYSSGLQRLGGNLVLNSDLSVDREIDIGFR
jgi:hypothetical protein